MSDARILDQGYRRYEGPRRGQWGAVRSLAWHSVLRALGLRRNAWAKLLPIAAVVIAYLPASVFVGIAVIVPENLRDETGLLPDYPEYYGFITAAIILFVALVGPEVLCSDRRNGMLGMYLASPLDRRSYLFAKVLAVLPVLGLVTLGPPLLLLISFTLANAGPETVVDVLIVFARVIASGLAISALYTAISLAASSLTERRAVASAGIILTLLASSIATQTLVERSGTDERVLLLDLFFLPFELVQRIYGAVGERPGIPTWQVVAAWAVWTLLASGLLWGRYRRLAVTR
jgi:ABC-2 type transport system permease protein